jgi:hypothetical protein
MIDSTPAAELEEAELGAIKVARTEVETIDISVETANAADEATSEDIEEAVVVERGM